MNKAHKTNRKNLEAAFALIDTDRSGGISREELSKFMGVGLTSEKLFTNLFSEIDVNGDGEISLDEFIAAVQQGL
jgi:Ca2+-binding EF-hand superfamily protein